MRHARASTDREWIHFSAPALHVSLALWAPACLERDPGQDLLKERGTGAKAPHLRAPFRVRPQGRADLRRATLGDTGAPHPKTVHNERI